MLCRRGEHRPAGVALPYLHVRRPSAGGAPVEDDLIAVLLVGGAHSEAQARQVGVAAIAVGIHPALDDHAPRKIIGLHRAQVAAPTVALEAVVPVLRRDRRHARVQRPVGERMRLILEILPQVVDVTPVIRRAPGARVAVVQRIVGVPSSGRDVLLQPEPYLGSR